MKPLTHAERVERYNERQKTERGLAQVRIWVPEYQIEKFKTLAKEARDDHRTLRELLD